MKHRDFVVLVRGEEEINALVASSHVVTTPATQTVPAFDTEHLTLVFIEPSGAGQTTGEGLRNSIKVQIDVPPVDVGKHFGWKEVDDAEPQVDQTAFDSAIAWREYAAKLETVVITDGHPIGRIASDETRTEPPTASYCPVMTISREPVPAEQVSVATADSAPSEPEVMQPDPAVVEAAQPVVEADPAVTEAAAS